MPDNMERAEIAELLGQLGSFNASTLQGDGECKLTGVCCDEDAIAGFRKAFHAGKSDWETLMQAAFESLVKAGQADAKYEYSDEVFGEFCDANKIEFYESGEIVV
jgi:hypothetical protein